MIYEDHWWVCAGRFQKPYLFIETIIYYGPPKKIMFDVGTNKGPHNGNLASVPNFGTVNTKMITSLIVIPRFLKKKKKKDCYS